MQNLENSTEKMNVGIEIWNGSGWNNYKALCTLRTLPVRTEKLLAANGIQRLEVSPADPDRPYGISARYYDGDNELVFTQRFDQHEEAASIRKSISTLLTEGIQNRINARAKELAHEAAIQRATAWRRNFDAVIKTKDASGPLREKIGRWRKKTGKFSRGQCWDFTRKILAGEMTFAAVREQFFGK